MNGIFLSEIIVENFRNLKRVEMAPNARFNVIAGKNGSGKTNLLESIYFFSALRSFRTKLRRELVKQGEDRAKLAGLFGGVSAAMKIEIDISALDRKIRKNGKEINSISEHFAELPMVLFHPANIDLVQGGPAERRRFMDRALFQLERSYPGLTADYQRALASRNKLLRSGESSLRALCPYDAQLASLGAEIVAARMRFVEVASDFFKETFEKISLGLEGTLVYRPDVAGDRSKILAAIESGLTTDRKRGFTARGPHADDLEISMNGLLARRFASQGQKRLIVLAMKIAETAALYEVTGRVPALLLDDISSELDRERNQELFRFLRQAAGQVFITTTHLDHVLLDVDRKDFEIRGGALA